MFDAAVPHDLPKPEAYDALAKAAGALVAGESDAIANMANVAALLWQSIPRINWAGFYRLISDELVLGPFAGQPACIRIPLGQGVCGVAAAQAKSQIVPDVHTFPGHIACDANSRSELVVPVMRAGTVIAVIDIDSPELSRFDQDDAAGIELLARTIGNSI